MTRDTTMLVGLGGVLAALYVLRRVPVATVTTSEGFDLSGYGGPTTYPEPLMEFARGIARAEGFYVAGSIPNRANNPGDLKLGAPYLPGTAITRFDSVDQGWNALYRQLYLILTGQSRRYTLDMSIADMGRVWTATVSEQTAWAGTVAAQVGATVDAPLWTVMA